MTTSGSLPPHNPLQRDPRHLPPPFGLWAHLSRHTGVTQPQPAESSNNVQNTRPSIAPLDKAGASTRILLHDTQAHLEKFGERVTQLTTGVADAKRELVAVQKLYQGDHEQLVERMIGLANRCQTELQKSMGTPAQSSELRDVLKAVEGLGKRMEALDKKVDALSMVGQTQSQALQNLQDQQGQILTGLLPLLPLLQAIPLHIENARNRVKDVVTDSKSDVQRWISALEGLVKQSSETLGNQLQSFLGQDQGEKGSLELRPHAQDPVSGLLRRISTPLSAGSLGVCLPRATARSRSASQKRPRSGSPSDTSSSDPAASPSASKRRRLGDPPGSAASPVRSPRPPPGTGPGRIHTSTVTTTAPPSSSTHASPGLLLPPAVRSSDRPVRTPLADLDPRTPQAKAMLNPGTSASVVFSSSVPKHQQPHGPRSTLLARAGPSPGFGATSLAFSPHSRTNNNTAQARARRPARVQALAAAAATPAGSSTHMCTTPPPILCATAPITPGAFKLPVLAHPLGLSRTATATATATPQPQMCPALHRSTTSSSLSLRRSVALEEGPGHPRRSSKARGEAQPSRARSHTPGLAAASASRGVAVHDARNRNDNGNESGNGKGDAAAHVSRVHLSLISVDAGGAATPRTPRLPADGRSDAPPPPPLLQTSAGKAMSLRDRRAMAMLAEDHRVRDEGKRFIPLDDEEDEEDAGADVDGGRDMHVAG